MDNILTNIVNMWGGYTLETPELIGIEGVHLYITQGNETRAILIVREFDEDWKDTLDVMIPEVDMNHMYKVENFFKAPAILAVSYCDRQAFIQIHSIYMLASQHSNRKHSDLTHDGNVFIPKENFTNLIKKGKEDGDHQEKMETGDKTGS